MISHLFYNYLKAWYSTILKGNLNMRKDPTKVVGHWDMLLSKISLGGFTPIQTLTIVGGKYYIRKFYSPESQPELFERIELQDFEFLEKKVSRAHVSRLWESTCPSNLWKFLIFKESLSLQKSSETWFSRGDRNKTIFSTSVKNRWNRN